MFKCNKISKPLIFVILCLAILFVLFYLNIIQINPIYLKEGMTPNSSGDIGSPTELSLRNVGGVNAPRPNTAVFFSKDDPNDQIGTSTERSDEQSRVNNEIKDYFNDNFIVNNDSYSGGFGANNFGWNNGVWLMNIETNKRLNYLQHSVDELRGIIDGVGKKLMVNVKLH